MIEEPYRIIQDETGEWELWHPKKIEYHQCGRYHALQCNAKTNKKFSRITKECERIIKSIRIIEDINNEK
jgi:hypothetical protein